MQTEQHVCCDPCVLLTHERAREESKGQRISRVFATHRSSAQHLLTVGSINKDTQSYVFLATTPQNQAKKPPTKMASKGFGRSFRPSRQIELILAGSLLVTRLVAFVQPHEYVSRQAIGFPGLLRPWSFGLSMLDQRALPKSAHLNGFAA